jgi:protoheme IX farnesyltransferase
MTTATGEQHRQALWRDYLELTKPKVLVLMLITSLVGMFLATRAGVPGGAAVLQSGDHAVCRRRGGGQSCGRPTH